MNYATNDPKGWCGDPSRGAALGRDSIHTDDYAGPLTLRRVLLDGDYDELGTYWGSGKPIYWYASPEGEVDACLRARDRVEAREAVLVRYPGASIDEVDAEDFVKEMLDGYVRAALWSTNDESTPSGGEPLDKSYGVDDIAPETFAEMREVCERFYRENAGLLLQADYPARRECTNAEMCGHDLWLTANGHGCGFWDGDCLPRAVGKVLADAARKIGETNLYVGDDGKIRG